MRRAGLSPALAVMRYTVSSLARERNVSLGRARKMLKQAIDDGLIEKRGRFYYVVKTRPVPVDLLVNIIKDNPGITSSRLCLLAGIDDIELEINSPEVFYFGYRWWHKEYLDKLFSNIMV